MTAQGTPDIARELLQALDGIESQFRFDHGLDVDIPDDPAEPDTHDPNVNRFEASIAAKLLSTADELIASPEILHWREKLSGSFPIGDLARVLADFRLVRPQLRLHLARRDVTSLEQKAQRVVDVLSLLLESPPTGRARAYLQRVSRCYVAGLEAETVIMCRAVLDAAFEERIPDSTVREHVGRRTPDRRPVLADRIAAASNAAIISSDLAKSARTVKDAGNDAVHNVPATTVESLDALRMTASVLAAIAI